MIFNDGAAQAARASGDHRGSARPSAGGDLGEWWNEQRLRIDGFRGGGVDPKPSPPCAARSGGGGGGAHSVQWLPACEPSSPGILPVSPP